MGVKSILDTGCGTGRGIKWLRERLPGVDVQGNDPSADLLRVASERHGIPESALHCADTTSLDFPPQSFDVVMSLAVLHHVPEPEKVIQRMIELARKAVFISDCNYIGQGRLPARAFKLLLTETRLWPIVKFVQQGCKGWAYSDGDGISYSYSVFNDLPMIRRQFKRVFVIPVGQGALDAIAYPKIQASTVLVGAIK
jgi:2-polyprenyl-3-methyl-5-hydroxy-6-metoxy-1,4-benzoquinol methylase